MTLRSRQGLIFLALAAVSCLALFVALSRYVGEVDSRVGELGPVLVVRDSIARMAPLSEQDVVQIQVPRRWTPSTAVTRIGELKGMVAAVAMTKGTLVQTPMVRRPPVLTPGLRSVALSLRDEADDGQEVAVGDRVDVVGIVDRSAVTVVRSALVLEAGRKVSGDRADPYLLLAVTPAETLTLATALKQGRVQLSLLPDPDTGSAAAPVRAAGTVGATR